MSVIVVNPAVVAADRHLPNQIFIIMKKMITIQLLMLATLLAFAQKTKELPPAWRHYKKIMALSPNSVLSF
jgi:hypothetical protein